MSPLLSISLATYNSSELLRVTLEAALPQVRAAGGRAELLVVDDGSTDGTASLAESKQSLGPFRYLRNERNLGSSANLVEGPTRHARGEFVWCWNQHSLLQPGALEHLLALLECHGEYDVFYANFRCASYPDDWPGKAVGGYDGPFRYRCHEVLANRPVDRWQELLEPASCLGTQSYAHIVRRSIWSSYWTGRAVGESYRDAPSTYPHTCMLAETVLNRPAFYIGRPLLTIFNGAQSWGDPLTRARVWMLGWPDLLRIFQREGLDREKLREGRRIGSRHAGEFLFGVASVDRSTIRGLFVPYLIRHGFLPGAASGLWDSYRRSDRPGARFIRAVAAWLSDWRRYCFRDCRPARWLRSRKNSRVDAPNSPRNGSCGVSGEDALAPRRR
jgi:hypothetical protein